MEEIIAPHIRTLLEKAVNEENGVRLDLGCGDTKQEGFLGVDKVKTLDVDIILDLEKTPYDIPDNCASLLLASHIVEHLKPWVFMDIMDEWWRILKPEGQLMIATPYAGSPMFWQDPTHVAGFTETTFAYFDPFEPNSKGELYKCYRTKPWKLDKCTFDIAGVLEVLLVKRPDDASYHRVERLTQ